MDDLSLLLRTAAEHAAYYRAGLPERSVPPQADLRQVVEALGGPLPDRPSDPAVVLEQLVAAAEPGLMSSAGPRFFGFVIGGSLPAATAAEIVAAGWDQCAFNAVLSPAAAAAEEVAGDWLKELLGIPPGSIGRLRHRCPGGEHGRAGRGAAPRPGGSRVGRREVRPAGRALGAGGRRRRAARHPRPLPSAARARHVLRRVGACRRERSDRRRRPRARAQPRARAGRSSSASSRAT